MDAAPYETFPALCEVPWLRHGFIQRMPGLDVKTERSEALARLEEHQRETIAQIGLGKKKLIIAHQVHGNRVVRVDASDATPIADCDGLLTNDPNVALGVYTADCGAIFLVDPEHRAIGLLHSGKKGTELEILTNAISEMVARFDTQPAELIVQLAPCIRPPHYEIDFAAQIRSQAYAAGVKHYVDCETSTATDRETYYSYRMELGKTGRLLSVLGYAD